MACRLGRLCLIDATIVSCSLDGSVFPRVSVRLEEWNVPDLVATRTCSVPLVVNARLIV